jgi:hypothetical protein
MPDRKQGYVKKGKGVLPPDEKQAAKYRARQKESPRHSMTRFNVSSLTNA